MRYFALLLTALLTVAVAVAGPAGAADPMPSFSGCGKAVKDNAGDAGAGDPVSSQSGAPDEVEMEGAFFNTGAGESTVNLIIKNLSGSVPPPATSITYNAVYGGVGDATNFVRAYLDFSGMVAYEYGHQEPLATTTRYAYDGPTTGALFPGEHGVVQIAIPAEAGGKAGTVLKGMTAEIQLGRSTVLPGAITQSPTRGLSYQNDNAAIGNVTVGPCAAGTTPDTTPPPPSTTPSPTTSQQTAGPLPVKLVSKSIKKAKAKKTVKIKVSSTEALTALGVRISKGTKAYGSGKLAKLNGKGTFKVKLAKALKKGTYAFDVAGTDSAGRRRVASFKLKVK